MVDPEKTLGTLIGKTIVGSLQGFSTIATAAAAANNVVLSSKHDGTTMAVNTNSGTQLDPGKPIYSRDAINVKGLIALAATIVPTLCFHVFFTRLT